VFRRLVLGPTRATRKLHQQGLIHKDITPAHIVVDEASGAAWLTGFGIATRLQRERTLPDPPELIAGTLAYMAPEQTGRMNRSVDARSDLYALGVIFYRMLIGGLPFTASDPMEWVHCHIARKPAQPCALVKTIPSTLSAIVMKLLVKPPRSATRPRQALRVILNAALQNRARMAVSKPSPVGEHDAPDWLLIPEKLYGRKRETGTLLAAFGHVVKTGRPELVLVSGYSGIGKSSVMNELHKVLVPPRGWSRRAKTLGFYRKKRSAHAHTAADDGRDNRAGDCPCSSRRLEYSLSF
jgi:serine/threonine protein kinase